MKTNPVKTNPVKIWAVAMAVVTTSLLSAESASATTFKVLGAMDLISSSPTGGSGFTINSTTGKMMFGGGVAAVFGGPAFGLEVGANYLTRSATINYTDSGGTGEFTAKWSSLQIPVLFRLNLGHVLSVGLGGYYSKALGTLSLSSGGVTQSLAFDDSTTNFPMKGSEYGGLASVAVDLPLGASTGLVIDGRYSLALSEVSENTTGYTWKPKDIQAFVGLRFGGSK
jgi:hypothetical protein